MAQSEPVVRAAIGPVVSREPAAGAPFRQMRYGAHQRLGRAMSPFDPTLPAAPLPTWRTQLRRTAVNAWHWLTHNLRVAFASGEIEGSLPADPAAVRALIRRIRVAMVTTRDRAGALHSEPMEASDRDFDGELWFPARQTAAILDRVRSRAAVQVTYLDNLSNRCVVLDGIARVSGGSGHDAAPTFLRIDIMSADIWE